MELTKCRFEIRDNPEREGEASIGVIQFTEPDTLNALTPDLALELDALLNEISRNVTLKVVIITGSGNGFGSGGNLHSEGSVLGNVTDIDSGLRGPYKRLAEYFLNDLFHHYMQRYSAKLQNLPQVTIAAINGWAVGAGLELMTMADIRIAGTSAKFSEAAVLQGFVTEAGGTRTLPAMIGKGRALEMILTGKVIDAEEAERIGLVEHVVPQEDLMDKSMELAAKICRQPFLSVRHAKDLVRHYWSLQTHDTPEGWQRELDAVLEIMRTDDNHEGIRSFVEKRPPQYRGPEYPQYRSNHSEETPSEPKS